MSEINYTLWAGVIGAGMTLVSCLLPTWRIGASRKTWPILSLFHLLFLLEIWAGYRHDLHDSFLNGIRQLSLYADKQTIQISIIIIMVCLAILIARWLFSRIRSHPATEKIAIFSSLMVFFLTVIEAISLHTIDAIFYTSIGPIRFIGWIWIICCMVTASTALLSGGSNLSFKKKYRLD